MKHVSENISVLSTDILSTQEWACDPDLIQIHFGKAFLEKARVCVDFMQSVGVHQVKIWFALSYDLFENIENVSDEGATAVIEHDSHQYVAFEPEYRLDGCHAEIDRDGDIRAEFPFKNTSDKLWAGIGNLKDLEAKLGESERSGRADGVPPDLQRTAAAR